MKLLLFLFCGTWLSAYSQTTQMPPGLYKVRELGTIYALLFNSFDPREASPDFLTSPENQNVINEFAQMIDTIYDLLEHHEDIKDIPRSVRYDIFFKQVDKIYAAKDFNVRPVPFKVFRYLFSHLFTNLDSNTHSDYCSEREEALKFTDDQIQEAINRVTSIQNIDRSKKGFKMLPGALFKHPVFEEWLNTLNLSDEEIKKTSLTTNHIISQKVLKQFKLYSDAILAAHRRELGKFDYYKIREHNKRKLMYFNIRSIYIRHGEDQNKVETGPITALQNDDNFLDFIRKIQLIPPGLTFLGPPQQFRSDDPDEMKGKHPDQKKKQERYRNRYGEYDENFEYGSKAILGEKYFNRVLELYKRIVEYNSNVNSRTLERTIELENEIENINFYREDRPYYAVENSDFEAIFFGWYPNEEWNYDDEKKLWRMKTLDEMKDDEENRPGTSGYRAVIATTTPTTSTTADVFVSLLEGLEVDDRFKYARDELRRRRHNWECPSDMRQSVDVTTNQNGFWCSPFYLRINPVQYFVCKILGHQNLHFF